MGKNMKLSTKLFLGFGSLVAITALLGLTGYKGLNRVNQLIGLNDQGKEAVNTLLECGMLRRDFVNRGFAKAEGQDKDASQLWYETEQKLGEQLADLETQSGLSHRQQEYLRESVRLSEDYRKVFDRGVEAQKMHDSAFASWGKVGWEITGSINEAMEKVVDPAIRQALEAGDIEAARKWTAVDAALNESVIQNFLTLRINAIYLVKTRADQEYNKYLEQSDKLDAGIAEWKNAAANVSGVESYISSVEKNVAEYRKAGEAFYQAILQDRKVTADMAAVSSNILGKLDDFAADLNNTVVSTTRFVNSLLIAVGVGSVLIGMALAYFITRSIVRPIHRIITDLQAGSEQVSAASSQVSGASQSLAEGATEQAAGLEETSSSLEEMSSMTKQNADNAQQANALATEARQAAEGGAESMERMSRAINDIQKSSDETAKIIRVIDEIAFQTNLLALNAAVEAARAGEAGKGFAVVAEEVRNLAMRSAEAAKNTANMIEGSVKNAKNGVEISNEVSKALHEIVAGIKKTSDLVGEIAAASQEQAQGIDQVNTAVAQMDKVTQQNAANAEESASASEELSAQAEQMKGIVQELTALVDGNSARLEADHKKQPAVTKGLKLTDHTFHHIAAGTEQKEAVTKGRESARKASRVIPLEGDFTEFNQ